jgi:predicted transcriptional regulator
LRSTLTIRLPEDLRAELEQISVAEKTPLSDIVRESLRRYVAIRQFRRLRRKVLPFAESQGLLTDEDVFEALR